jgi:hypothetical protein
MKTNKASGPGGFPIEFYQKYWSLCWIYLCFVSRKVVENGKVNIMVNDKVGPYFVTNEAR